MNLGYLFQPASEGDEDEEHRRRVEEGDGVYFCLLRHGHYEDDERVGEGYGGGQNYQHVHVGGSVFDGFVGLNVKVASSDKLGEETQKSWHSQKHLRNVSLRLVRLKLPAQAHKRGRRGGS